ncbi:MAG: hypothetical protein BWK79_07860, partial [Beggiatoa sp. IS2]
MEYKYLLPYIVKSSSDQAPNRGLLVVRMLSIFSLLVLSISPCETISEPLPGDTTATITGGIAINGGESQSSAVLNLSDSVAVSGTIIVDSAHVGQIANLFVYAETTIPSTPDILYFMLKGEPELEILVWDQNPANLVAFQSNVTLAAEQKVSMYSGNFIYPGTLKVYFGYQLADGTLAKNTQSIDIVINDDTAASSTGISIS